MGARQSNAQTSASNTNSPRTQATGNDASASSSSAVRVNGLSRNRLSNSGSDWRQRARSLTNVINGHSVGTANGQSIVGIPSSGQGSFGLSASPDSDTSTEDVSFGRVFSAHSLPVQLVPFSGKSLSVNNSKLFRVLAVKCPVCSKTVLPEDVECHLVMCLTKPRISYNEDILTENKGECVICLDDLSQGDTIARLPCLCIYHKSCIDSWFEVNRSCPEHPSD
ncbi:E3 ubiquitin-protein ligase ZNRF2-like protein [Leptotrombidium deliense]|uniref:E3 ubiquitin-protein ligase ZNRF1 n=1 Tax=Leptotrombidium deliense TaxID=299467 RepID=A0A443SQK7_9ACAR|nr:E3 ubiquitin-protein ligase ZNRF2-like protein [Leptotrombidium deliense]